MGALAAPGAAARAHTGAMRSRAAPCAAMRRHAQAYGRHAAPCEPNALRRTPSAPASHPTTPQAGRRTVGHQDKDDDRRLHHSAAGAAGEGGRGVGGRPAGGQTRGLRHVRPDGARARALVRVRRQCVGRQVSRLGRGVWGAGPHLRKDSPLDAARTKSTTAATMRIWRCAGAGLGERGGVGGCARPGLGKGVGWAFARPFPPRPGPTGAVRGLCLEPPAPGRRPPCLPSPAAHGTPLPCNPFGRPPPPDLT